MQTSFDAVVVGAGLGGLTAGALAAKAGRRVLLLERHDRFGGAATIFERPGLTVEVGLHELDGLDEGDVKRRLFAELGLAEQVRFVPLPEFYAVHAPGLGTPFVMPHGLAAARAATQARFPQHRAALDRWFDTLEGIRRRLTLLAENQGRPLWWLLNGPVFPLRFWPILRHERTTVGALLEALFGDDDAVKVALCANYQYYTDKLGELSLLYFAAAQGSYHHGGYYVRGGSQALSDSLAETIRRAGGCTLTKRIVTRIETEGGRVRAVVHTDRKGKDPIEVRAPVVFGNASPHALRDMLAPDLRPAFEADWKDCPLSTSLWSVYLGFDVDPTDHGMPHYSSFFYGGTLAASERPLLAGAPEGGVPCYAAVNYSRVEHGLGSSDGRHLVVLTGVDRLEHWQDLDRAAYKAKKQSWLQTIRDDFLSRHPALAHHVVYEEMSTARTVQRYLRTPGGAVYGFAQRPAQAGRHRIGAKTNVSGLLLASAFAQPGGGFTGAMLAGWNAFSASGLR